MTEPRQRARRKEQANDATVWIDHDRAVIVEQGKDDQDTTEYLERSSAESQPAFELRTIHEIIERDRIVVSGPAVARLGFERAYSAMTHRPDRIVDVEPDTPTSRRARPTV